MSARKIAVIGAGPIGLEAALYGLELGHDVHVYERGHVGDNVSRWGFVRLFSPDSMNRSALGQRVSGTPGGGDALYLTGGDYVAGYLQPLANSGPLSGRVHENARVVRIGRDRISKQSPMGRARAAHPFRLLVDRPGGEALEHADVVLDCSGTYGNSRWLGNGNVPALGERSLRPRIDYTLQDVTGEARTEFEGRSVLLIGAGMSAVTALDGLLQLGDVRVAWVVRSSREQPYDEIPNDPLPERARLAALGNRIAGQSSSRVRYHAGTVVEQLSPEGRQFGVGLATPDGRRTLVVDRVLAHVGSSPDSSLHRELQVHECYATMGPMKLASTLLASDSTDCLRQPTTGPEALTHPEPDFFILGSKSYGRNPAFLIRNGLEQIRQAYSVIST